jgi:hypothetical protein
MAINNKPQSNNKTQSATTGKGQSSSPAVDSGEKGKGKPKLTKEEKKALKLQKNRDLCSKVVFFEKGPAKGLPMIKDAGGVYYKDIPALAFRLNAPEKDAEGYKAFRQAQLGLIMEYGIFKQQQKLQRFLNASSPKARLEAQYKKAMEKAQKLAKELEALK